MADVTDESGLREKIARVIRLTVRSNTYRDERGHTRMGLGLNGVDEATDQIMALISPAGEVVVPVEPTREQQLAMDKALLDNWPKLIGGDVCVNGRLTDAVYAAALSAAPRGMEG